ncbi:craniofacial development protein 2-like [Mytilus trossulus]|uniref:craniofacial development protein 2-like n=1 Tax=Mytilus trossulus TaxID=6551 RepID=UPI003005868B
MLGIIVEDLGAARALEMQCVGPSARGHEVRWLDSGQLTLQNGKVLLYSGRNDGLHQAGVGMMLASRAKKALIEWKPITERLMYAIFHTSIIKISIITVYAPSNDATDETKESFIEQLDRVIAGTHKHDIILVIGDFNAKGGMNNEDYENIMGRHGIGRRNENGENLLDICQRNNLVITGTTFPQKVKWISPNKKTENQIDHILVTRQHRTSILDTRAMRGADIGSDHKLLKCKLRIKLKKYKIVTDTSRKIFDTTKLQRPEIRKAFSIELKNRFQLLDQLEDREPFWEGITKCYKETATNTLSFKERGQKPWISNESWKLVDERRQLKERTNKKS